jgi:hypothetical protein
MPIAPYLRNQAFDPKSIKEMSSVFTDACADIGLADRADPMTELVALQIIEFAQRGVQTRSALSNHRFSLATMFCAV